MASKIMFAQGSSGTHSPPEPTPLLKNRSFLSLWLGECISEMGGSFGALCISTLLFQMTGSAVAMGNSVLMYFVPSLLMQLFVGPYLDRWSRKWIMVSGQWMRGLIFLVPLTMLSFGHLQPWHLYLVQLVIGLIQPLYVPSSFAIFPTLIASEQLTTANAYFDGTVRLMGFLAPPVGGFVAAGVGAKPALLYVSLFFFLSGCFLLNLKEPPRQMTTRKETWVRQFSKGMKYFFQQRLLLWLGIFVSFVQFAVGVTMVLTMPYVEQELGGGTAAYGLFVAGFPFGYFLGSLLVSRTPEPTRRRLVMLGALVIGGSTFMMLSVVHMIGLAVLLEILGGICMPFFNVHSTSLYQRRVPNEILGQILSVRLLLIRSVMPVGAFVGGHAGQMIGIRPVYLMMGALIWVMSLLGITLPYFRFLNEETPITPHTPRGSGI